MTTEAKTTETDFSQVCVWPGCIIEPSDVETFEQWLIDDFDCRVKFIECVTTTPDMKNGEPVPDTGGRIDALFYIHNDDINKFALRRLVLGVRWIEDVIDNMGDNFIYPERVKEYRKW